MTNAEEFIENYFRERSQLQRSWLEFSAPFQERFFLDPKALQGRRGSEEIVRIEEGNDVVAVVTNEVAYEGLKANTFRYHLVRFGDSWKIRSKEWECIACNGRGVRGQLPCDFCGGSGWKEYGKSGT